MDKLTNNDTRLRVLWEYGELYFPFELSNYDEESGEVDTIIITKIGYKFADRYNEGKLGHKFTYEEYLKNSSIQLTLEAMNIDREDFWWLMLFIYDIVYMKNRGGIAFATSDSAFEKLSELVDVIGNVDLNKLSIDFRVNGRKKYSIKPDGKKSSSELRILQFILEGFNQKLKEAGNDEDDDFHKRQFWGEKVDNADSMILYYAYLLFQNYFEMKKDVIPKRRTKEMDAEVTLDKRIFISRLLHFMRMTYNDGFLNDGEYLKGIINKYKGTNFNNRFTDYD